MAPAAVRGGRPHGLAVPREVAADRPVHPPVLALDRGEQLARVQAQREGRAVAVPVRYQRGADHPGEDQLSQLLGEGLGYEIKTGQSVAFFSGCTSSLLFFDNFNDFFSCFCGGKSSHFSFPGPGIRSWGSAEQKQR